MLRGSGARDTLHVYLDLAAHPERAQEVASELRVHRGVSSMLTQARSIWGLHELRDEGRVVLEGKRRWARWKVKTPMETVVFQVWSLGPLGRVAESE